jgi:hypothetical protein
VPDAVVMLEDMEWSQRSIAVTGGEGEMREMRGATRFCRRGKGKGGGVCNPVQRVRYDGHTSCAAQEEGEE